MKLIKLKTLLMPILLSALVAAGPACQKKAPPPQVTAGAQTWRVELAMTPTDRYKGLSDRYLLPEGQGMLFIYPSPRELFFCMRDCYIPLDIAFLSADRRVIRTYTMDVEADRRGTTVYNSGQPAQYALEVPAGSLRRVGVKVGDPIIFTDVPDATKAQDDP